MVVFISFKLLNRLKMDQELHRCITNVGGANHIRYGKSKSGKQRFKCKSCGKTFQENYSYLGSLPDTSDWILKLLKEGTGIRSIARLLNISPTTVLRRILSLSKSICKPHPHIAICNGNEKRFN